MNNSSADFNRWEYQIIALAACVQCASLVRQLAWEGAADERALASAINPLLVLDPQSVNDIYPNIVDLSPGLRALQDMFDREHASSLNEVINYTLNILSVRGRLMSNEGMQQQLRQRLATMDPLRGVEAVSEEDISTNERRYEQIARLYQDTISHLSFRIQVKGKAECLQQTEVANRIRALLLAGIRSAVLWHQLGGRRWTLLLYRGRIRETAADIRRKLIVTH